MKEHPLKMEFDLALLNPYHSKIEANKIVFETELGEKFVIYFADAEGYFPNFEFGNHIKMFGFYSTASGNNSPRIKDTIIFHLLK